MAESAHTTTASISDAHAHLIQRLITSKPHQIRYSADARDLEERAPHVQAIGNASSAGRAVRREGTTGSYLCPMPGKYGSPVSSDAQETRRNGQGRVSDHRDRHHIRLERSGHLPT